MVGFETVPGVTVQATSANIDLPSLSFRLHVRAGASGFASLSSALQPASQRNPVFSLAKAAPISTKQEKGYRILKIKGDGRCMFRALAQGLSRNKGVFLDNETETREADELRLAVRDALCRSEKRKKEFKDAIFSLEATEGPIGRYCQRLGKPSFWGGEVELLVLSKMLHTPIFVYNPAEEGGKTDGGVIPIARYGEEFSKASKKVLAPRRPIRLLFYQGNHYNLLL